MELNWNEVLYFSEMQPTVASFLKVTAFFQGVEVKSIAEIGVYRGVTSSLLRLLFPEATLYLIDPWQIYEEGLSDDAAPISQVQSDYDAAYRMVMKSFEGDRKTVILRTKSENGARLVPDPLDLIYIDGNHSYKYVKDDLERWVPKVRKGGIISGHDYNQAHPDLVKAVDEFFKEPVTVGFDDVWWKLNK